MELEKIIEEIETLKHDVDRLELDFDERMCKIEDSLDEIRNLLAGLAISFKEYKAY